MEDSTRPGHDPPQDIDADALHRLLETAPEASALLRPDGHVVWGNAAFRRLTGLAPGAALADALAPQDRPGLVQRLRDAAAGRSPAPLEARLAGPGRGPGSLRGREQAPRPERGVLWRIGPGPGTLVAHGREVTTARRAVTRVAELERRAGIASFALRPGSGALDWSAGALRILGRAPERVRDLLDLCAPEARPRLARALEELAGRGAGFVTEVPLVLPRGRIALRIGGRAEMAGGVVQWCHGTLQDVSEIRAQERRLIAAERAASAAEARLRAAIEALEEGFALYDAEDRLVLANRRYREIYSYAAEVLEPGVRFEEILRHGLAVGEPDFAQGWEEEWLAQRMRQHREACGYTERPLHGRWLRIYEKETPEGGRVGLRIDITEMKERERALEEARSTAEARGELLEAIPQYFGLGLNVFDADLRLAYANDRFYQMLDFPRELFPVGTRFEAFLRYAHAQGEYADTDEETLVAERLELVRKFLPHRLERHRRNGRVLELLGRPLPSGGFVTTYRDITEERTRKRELERARTAAEAANEAKSAFLATMSHEIRTPMNGVLGLAAALADTALDPCQRELVEGITGSGDTLMALLNDILDLSRIEAGRLTLEDGVFALAELVGPLERAHRHRAEAKGLAFRAHAAPGLEGHYRGDLLRVRQILDNLLANAVKFTGEGAVSLVVGRLGTGQEGLLFEVADTGPGLPEGAVERLFEAFTQADHTTTREHGGSGLGLAICRRLAAMMGATLSAQPADRGGALFRLALPTARVAAPARAEGHGAGLEEALRARRLRLLVAEDGQTNRLVLSRMLQRIDAALTEVADGEAAVAAWARERPDAILMDVRMPRMDGVAAARAIRLREAEEGWSATPIIALTANVMAAQVAGYRAAGMAQHVAKPVRREALFAALATATGDGAPAAAEPDIDRGAQDARGSVAGAAVARTPDPGAPGAHGGKTGLTP